jgi:glutamyl-tRNA reductase
MARVNKRKNSSKSVQNRRRTVVKLSKKVRHGKNVSRVNKKIRSMRSRKMKGILSKLKGAASNLQSKLNNMSNNATSKALEKIYQKNPRLRPVSN